MNAFCAQRTPLELPPGDALRVRCGLSRVVMAVYSSDRWYRGKKPSRSPPQTD